MRSKSFFNQYLFFNHTNVNNIDIKKYSRKPGGVIFSTDFFVYQKDKDLLTIEKPPIINIYITYKTLAKTLHSEFILRNCLFGAVKVTNKSNSDKDMWQYNGYGIAFHSIGEFTPPSGQDYAKNFIIFGAGSSSSIHSSKKLKIFWCLEKISFKK